MKKGKLLIIDDNEDILFALNLLLEPYMEQIRVATQPERIDHFMRTFIPDKEDRPGRGGSFYDCLFGYG